MEKLLKDMIQDSILAIKNVRKCYTAEEWDAEMDRHNERVRQVKVLKKFARPFLGHAVFCDECGKYIGSFPPGMTKGSRIGRCCNRYVIYTLQHGTIRMIGGCKGHMEYQVSAACCVPDSSTCEGHYDIRNLCRCNDDGNNLPLMTV